MSHKRVYAEQDRIFLEPLKKKCVAVNGQSLVELVLVAVVLVPILFGAAYVGMAMYQGSLASSAIQAPLTERQGMAGKPEAVTAAELQGYATATGSNPLSASLDGLTLSDINPDNKLMVGIKNSIAVPIIGSFRFTVIQPIQSGLLAENTGTQVALTDYYGSSTPIPAENGAVAHVDKLKSIDKLSYTNGCASANYGEDYLRRMVGNRNIYDNRRPVGGNSRFSYSSISTLYGAFAAECANEVGVCQQEYDTLKYKFEGSKLISGTINPDPAAPPTDFVTERSHLNIPGQANLEMRAVYTCHSQPPGTKCTGPVISSFGRNPSFGLYLDATGNFKKVPDSFKTDCIQYEVAKCQLRMALELANSLEANYPKESSCN